MCWAPKIPGKKIKYMLTEKVKQAIYVRQKQLHFFFTLLSLHAIAVRQVKGFQVLSTLLQFLVQFQKEIRALLHLLPDTFLLIFQPLRLLELPFVTQLLQNLLGICDDHLVTACSRRSELQNSQNCKRQTLTASTLI